ncbi:MAG: ribosomal L7Ae/L30e/S12e/Gadd45 family protein [Acholeplasma sp.]|nr:ribosomal L7Ae/L30e/S12e/Gadd45 family protein [Acholeplasma sp.]
MDKTIGLANRARKIVTGTEQTIKNVKNGKVKLVIIALDAAINTQKLVNDKCKTYNVEVLSIESSKILSDAIGKNNIMVIGVVDDGFRRLILNQKRK